MRRVGGEHERAVARRGGERGGAGGDGGLPDAALAREQQDADHASAQLLDPLLEPLQRGVDEQARLVVVAIQAVVVAAHDRAVTDALAI